MTVDKALIVKQLPIRVLLSVRSAIHILGKYFLSYSGNRVKLAEFFVIFWTIDIKDLNKHYKQIHKVKYIKHCIDIGLMGFNEPSNRYYLTALGIECLNAFNSAYDIKFEKINFRNSIVKE